MFDLSHKLKPIIKDTDRKKLSVSYFLAFNRAVQPYDPRFYQATPWPEGLEIGLSSTKAARAAGVERMPSAVVQFGSEKAVIPAESLVETVNELLKLQK